MLGVGAPLVVGLIHVALIAPHYFVGSFDDDSSYIMGAKALIQGQGLTGHLTSGAVVVGLYPPGYSALLAPLVWIWPHTYVPLRLLSVASYAAVFVLTWIYLGRRGVGERVRIATLGVLALAPPLATFGSMVMAETPYLVLLLITLLLVDRWDGEAKVLTATGVAVVLAGGGLVWLKQAGIGAVGGLILWLILCRDERGRWRRAAAVAGGTALLLLPVVIARLVTNTPVLGSRYSSELGTFYQGSLVSRVVDVFPKSLWHFLANALPTTLTPYFSPLSHSSTMNHVWQCLYWSVTVLVVVGAVTWWKRHRDAGLALAAVYLLETLFWPEVNERRAILVVPLLAAWYVLGAVTVGQAIRARVASRSPRAGEWVRWVGVVAVLGVFGPLVPQMPRDYLFALGQDSSRFEGSRYVALLAHLGRPSDVVESDYLSSTALFTGHVTADTAFLNTLTSCRLSVVEAALAADRASYLLLGDVNKPGHIDSPCLFGAVQTNAWAVTLLHTDRDNATVYELIGSGTGNPDLTDLNGAVVPSTVTADDSKVLQWVWPSASRVDQLSVGEAALSSGPTTSVSIQLLTTAGVWVTASRSASAVGDGSGAAPYLLATPAGVTATGMRVVLTGPGAGGAASVTDVGALGEPST